MLLLLVQQSLLCRCILVTLSMLVFLVQQCLFIFIITLVTMFLFRLRRYNKHSRLSFIGSLNTLNSIKNILLFSLFGYPDQYCLSCLLYYMTYLKKIKSQKNFLDFEQSATVPPCVTQHQHVCKLYVVSVKNVHFSCVVLRL